MLRAAKRLGISPAECLVVGDRMSDILCAENAGAEGVLVLTGKGEREKEQVLAAFPNVKILRRFDEIAKTL